MSDARLDSIEARLREERKPTLENLLRQVEERPGYHTLHWWLALRAFVTFRGEQRAEFFEWVRVTNSAIREKKIQRDHRGGFWIYGTKPPFSDIVREWCDLHLANLLWYLAGLLLWSVVCSGIAKGAEMLGASDVEATVMTELRDNAQSEGEPPVEKIRVRGSPGNWKRIS